MLLFYLQVPVDLAGSLYAAEQPAGAASAKPAAAAAVTAAAAAVAVAGVATVATVVAAVVGLSAVESKPTKSINKNVYYEKSPLAIFYIPQFTISSTSMHILVIYYV